MSTKEWKNGEINTLLTEKWGFRFDPNNLNEATGGAGGELTSKEAEEEEGDDPPVSKREEEGNLEEDSGEEEGRHYEHDAMHDDDHIRAIRHHLDALEHDKDYDEEHEDLEERRARGRASPRSQRGPADPRQRPMEESRLSNEQIREVARRVITRIKETKKNG